MFTHLVFFKLKEPSAAQVDALVEKLRSLEGRVPQIEAIEVGADVIRSERSYDVGLITRFADRAAMEAYQIHPYHQEVLAYVRGVVSDVKAVDF